MNWRYWLISYSLVVTVALAISLKSVATKSDEVRYWYNETNTSDARYLFCNAKMSKVEEHYLEKVVEEQEEEKICEFEERSNVIARKRLSNRINSDSKIIGDLRRCYYFGMDIDKCVGVDLEEYLDENDRGSFK